MYYKNHNMLSEQDWWASVKSQMQLPTQKVNEINEPTSNDGIAKYDPQEKEDNFNLCIIATQAENRIDIFKDIFKLKIRNILTEKIVTQSEDDFLFILNESKKLNIKIWVNCKTRCYPQWQYIKNTSRQQVK